MVEGIEPSEVGTALQASVGLFTRHLRQVPIGDQLSFGELQALSHLDRLGPSTASELARAEQVSPQAIGVTVAELEQRGLIERRGDPRDKRRVLVSLTAAGRTTLGGRRDTRTEQITQVLREHFTATELRILFKAAPLIERLGRELR